MQIPKWCIGDSGRLTIVVIASVVAFGGGACSSDSSIDTRSAGGSVSVSEGGASVGQGGGTVSSSSDGSASGGTLSNSAHDADFIGVFSVKLTPESAALGTVASTDFRGAVRTAALPEPKIWTVQAEGNGCQLLVPSVPFCEAACSASEFCSKNGSCAVVPSVISVGDVKVSGIKTTDGADEFTVQPTSSLVYLFAKAAFPPFAEGEAVTLSAEGGSLNPFTITARGISAIAGTPTSLSIAKEQAAEVTWEAAGLQSHSTIEVNLDVSQHGGTKGMITCKGPDNGRLQIPKELITKLINLGVAGFPTITVTRNSVGTAKITPGLVELLLTSSIEVPVAIPGLTSCNDVTPCPIGKKCQTDYTCL